MAAALAGVSSHCGMRHTQLLTLLPPLLPSSQVPSSKNPTPPHCTPTSGTSSVSASRPSLTAPSACRSRVKLGYSSGRMRSVRFRPRTCTRAQHRHTQHSRNNRAVLGAGRVERPGCSVQSGERPGCLCTCQPAAVVMCSLKEEACVCVCVGRRSGLGPTVLAWT